MLCNKERRLVAYGLFCLGLCLPVVQALANPAGPDQPIEDSQVVDEVGDGVQGAIDVVSDATNNIVTLYTSTFLGAGGANILAKAYPLGEPAADAEVLQTLCSTNCNHREAAASGRSDGQFVLLWTGDNVSGDPVLYSQMYGTQLSAIGSRQTIDAAGALEYGRT
ncbi:hypothetical protein [Salinisphaera sp. C84B14]|uniref:hypothetical protein n=1 Tax=Salinisphaera sp. C84B14 TaxID=1304155 RepID=UPI00333F4CEC